MFILISGLIVVSSFIYYRKSIFNILCKYIILTILGIIKVYYYFKKDKDGIKIKKCINIHNPKLKNKNLKVEEYEIKFNSKKHNIVLIGDSSRSLTEQINDLVPSISDNLKYKNQIVYCSIVNENGDIIIELTNMLRSFVYYFDKEDFKLSLFFDYVQDYIDERFDIYNGVNVYDFDFMIYLNDLTFTELGYKINYIKDKSIIDILIKNDL